MSDVIHRNNISFPDVEINEKQKFEKTFCKVTQECQPQPKWTLCKKYYNWNGPLELCDAVKGLFCIVAHKPAHFLAVPC